MTRKPTKPAKVTRKTETKKALEKKPSISKPWLHSYPPMVNANIGPLEYDSLGALFENSFAKYGDSPAFTCMGKTATYSDLLNQSSRIGAWLRSKGLEKGDRVAIMMPNILQYPAVLTGILRAGMTVVNVNPLYTPRELEHQLKDSGAKAIFILENFAITLEKVIAKTSVEHVVVTAMGDMFGGLKGMLVNFVLRKVKKMVPNWSLPGHTAYTQVAATSGYGFASEKMNIDDIAFLQYTGGTTGVSKGAALSHSNVLSNVAQNDEWLKAINDGSGLPAGSTYICALPLYHIFALTVNAVMGMQRGAHNILIPNPRDIPGCVKELGNYQFEVFPGLNTLFNGLLNNDEFQKLDFSNLLLTLGGGMAVQQPVADAWHKLTGSVIAEGYGLSETSPVATANRFDGDKFSGTIGLPLPSTIISINDEKGKELPIGEVGEIYIKGPQVMAGYWERPDETANVMTRNGFFKSGDMGFMDEAGQTKIVDRKKDMILVSGFNVYPNEIEEVAAGHVKILEAAAIGIRDDKTGEAVKLFIVRTDTSLTKQDVKDWCAEGLTNYKRPKFIEFRDELPKTNVGKILRRELRDE
jgi:long-chain acyl-CoA synthetase